MRHGDDDDGGGDDGGGDDGDDDDDDDHEDDVQDQNFKIIGSGFGSAACSTPIDRAID